MAYRIIADSSSNILTSEDASYKCVPLKIITDEKEYIDDITLDTEAMISDLQQYSDVSKTSCPNVADWKESFGEEDDIFCVTITSNLSGSYNAASLAVQDYLEEHPDKRALVIDTLSTGPENALVIEKLQELTKQNLSFDEIENKIKEYMNKLHLIFSLESLRNLANNGRCSKAVAGLAGILNIRVVGQASEEGTLEITNKVRGTKNALSTIFENMLKNGYNGGNVRIHHCQNESAAKTLAERIKTAFPKASIQIALCAGLCSFYAEAGGLLIGFEG